MQGEGLFAAAAAAAANSSSETSGRQRVDALWVEEGRFDPDSAAALVAAAIDGWADVIELQEPSEEAQAEQVQAGPDKDERTSARERLVKVSVGAGAGAKDIQDEINGDFELQNKPVLREVQLLVHKLQKDGLFTVKGELACSLGR